MAAIKNIALVSAAGSGKTHALTKRFLFLLLHENNYPLESLYAITFTNAAAYEMKSRILRYLDVLTTGNTTKEQEKDVLDYFSRNFSEKEIKDIASCKKEYLLNNLSNLNVSTFHSMFASFLSVIPFEAGILPEYRIIEEQEEALILEQTIDRYFEQAYNNKESGRAVLELIELQEKNVKDLLGSLYGRYKPWFFMLSDLSEQKEKWLRISKDCNEKAVEVIKEYKDFVEMNIETTYTQRGTIHKNWAGFLDKIGKFIINKDYETLKPLLEYFMEKERMEKDYFVKFKDKLSNPRQYEKIIGQIIKRISADLEALSNSELIIYFQPLIEIHKIFQAEKKKQNIITFSDIEDYILLVLKKNPEIDYLYFKLGADINHLMIDEFQDTSYKQIDILEPILNEITAYNPEEKSLFYVGDPHQAIFRWRQGAPELFDELKETYKEKISDERLEKNYRTKKEIIEFVNKVLGKDDKADPDNTGGWLRIEGLGEFNNKEEGNEATMNRVVEIIKDLKNHGYKESDIAILTRQNKFAAEMAGILSKNGIPCLSRSRASIMDEPDVRFIIHLLKFLDNPEDNFSLLHILVSDIFNLSEELIRSIRYKKKTLFLAFTDIYRDWEVTKKLQELLSFVYFMNPYQLIFNICKCLNLKISYPIATLLDAAIEYINDGCGSLSDFIKWLEHYGPTIEIKETQFEGVRIMTIHKAKGLEFETVIIPETNLDESKNSKNPLIFSYADKARPEKIYLRKYGKYLPGLKEKEEELAQFDNLNLLYVALTRAKSGVYMLGFKRKKGNSGFWFEKIKEKFSGMPLPLDEIPKKEFFGLEKEQPEKPYTVTAEEIPRIREEREIYSPTERGIEIIEQTRRQGMKFGDIVHRALNKVEWLDGLEIDKVVGDILKFVKDNYARTLRDIEDIEHKLKPLLIENFTDPELRFIFYKDRRNAKFKNELALYFEEEKRDVSVHIDRIIFESDKITIVDYKTGGEKLDYKHQVQMYKQGIRTIYPDIKIKTILLYLENNRGAKLKITD